MHIWAFMFLNWLCLYCLNNGTPSLSRLSTPSLCMLFITLSQDSSAPYQPDPIQLRLSGLGSTGINSRKEATPPPPPPPPLPPLSYTYQPQPPSSSSVNVPFLSAVISSLTAEKLAAILIQNSALGPNSIVGAPSTVPYQQQLSVPSLPLPLYLPPASSLPGSEVSSYHGTEYGTEVYRWEAAVHVTAWICCVPRASGTAWCHHKVVRAHAMYINKGSVAQLLTCDLPMLASLVPRPIPSFSMLHTEKWEGLVREITCVTWSSWNTM